MSKPKFVGEFGLIKMSAAWPRGLEKNSFYGDHDQCRCKYCFFCFFFLV